MRRGSRPPPDARGRPLPRTAARSSMGSSAATPTMRGRRERAPGRTQVAPAVQRHDRVHAPVERRQTTVGVGDPRVKRGGAARPAPPRRDVIPAPHTSPGGGQRRSRQTAHGGDQHSAAGWRAEAIRWPRSDASLEQPGAGGDRFPCRRECATGGPAVGAGWGAARHVEGVPGLADDPGAVADQRPAAGANAAGNRR